ncbi:hypothetical protein OAC51_02995 [Flavobacteriaceae bacterium]|nr:hypothetical protein [Flavobacteriaceae bacterium]
MEEYQDLDDLRKNKIIESAKKIYFVSKKGSSEVFDLPKYEAQRKEILDKLKYADISKFPSEDLKEQFSKSIQNNMQINISSNDLNKIFAEAFLLCNEEAINTIEQKIKNHSLYQKKESDPSAFINLFYKTFIAEVNGLANEDIITNAAEIYSEKIKRELSYHKGKEDFGQKEMLLTSESDNEYESISIPNADAIPETSEDSLVHNEFERVSIPNADAIPETGKDSLADIDVKNIMKKFKPQINGLKNDIIVNHKSNNFHEKDGKIFAKVYSNLYDIFSNKQEDITSNQVNAIAIKVMKSLQNFYWRIKNQIHKKYSDIFEKHQKELKTIEDKIVNDIRNGKDPGDKERLTLFTEGFIKYFNDKEKFPSEGINFEELKVAIQKKAKEINAQYRDVLSETEKTAALNFLKENKEIILAKEQEIIKEFADKGIERPKEKTQLLPKFLTFFKTKAPSQRIAVEAATRYSHSSYKRIYARVRKEAGIDPNKYNKNSVENSKIKSLIVDNIAELDKAVKASVSNSLNKRKHDFPTKATLRSIFLRVVKDQGNLADIEKAADSFSNITYLKSHRDYRLNLEVISVNTSGERDTIDLSGLTRPKLPSSPKPSTSHGSDRSSSPKPSNSNDYNDRPNSPIPSTSNDYNDRPNSPKPSTSSKAKDEIKKRAVDPESNFPKSKRR